MNKSSIEEVSSKLGVIKGYLETMYQESLALVEKERQLDRNKEIILRKEGDVNNKVALLNTEKNALELKLGTLEQEKTALSEKTKTLELRESKFQEQLAILIKQKVEVEGKIADLKNLEERKKDLDEREQGLLKRLQDLTVREALIEKEKIIDRERKDKLTLEEANLKRKQDKLQRMIDA